MSGSLRTFIPKMYGGKKKKTKKNKRKRSCVKRGGSYSSLLRDAIIPFGLFALTKRREKNNNKKNKKTFRKNSTKKR